MHPGKTDTMVLDFVNEADDIELKRTGDPALGFAERSGLVLEHQWATREEGRLAHRLKNAQLTIDASVEEIDFSAARGLDRAVISDLADRACRYGHTALYKCVPRLVFKLSLARADGSYLKALEKIAKADLLILDDWGISPLEVQAAADLMDVVDDRAGRSSTIVTSQPSIARWRVALPAPPLGMFVCGHVGRFAGIAPSSGGASREPRGTGRDAFRSQPTGVLGGSFRTKSARAGCFL